MDEITERREKLYQDAVNTPSDMNEYCPKLREMASQCRHVTEFGMRYGTSSSAILAGQPDVFLTYDVNMHPYMYELAAVKGKTDFHFIWLNTLHCTIQETDFLFIDTWHAEWHLEIELSLHADKVRRWIGFHDTCINGEVGCDGSPGLLPGIRKFLVANPQWFVIYHVSNNSGFTVISRDERDRSQELKNAI